MEVTTPYKFIGFGAMGVTKQYSIFRMLNWASFVFGSRPPRPGDSFLEIGRRCSATVSWNRPPRPGDNFLESSCFWHADVLPGNNVDRV